MKNPENIIISNDLRQALAKYFRNRNYSKIAVIVDENTHRDCYPLVSGNLPEHHLIRIKSGEENKNLETCSKIWGEMTRCPLDRNALVINLGGGVIGDMGGFCASTYKRGVKFINLPTTLLAQVDASIGGKLGIDFQGFKNHIGLFRDPEKVFIYSGFLSTLSRRELRSGFSEVIKHCLIADGKMFDKLNKLNLDQIEWDKVIPHSILVKYHIISADPMEKGLRKILNFGHTVGHAVESHYLKRGKNRLLHGEAVAIGMLCESWLSTIKTGLSETELHAISTYLRSIYQMKAIPESDIKTIINLTIQDKKNNKGIINCSLLEQIGRCTYDITVTPDEIRESINYYNHQLS